MITHIELFAGISGFGLGFEQNGIVTIATVEKDAKARALLQYHYPNILHLDDVKTAGKHNLPYADIISFGSPCQDLSIAGKRKGLEGERSGLFWEAIRIVDELKPAFAVWENVADAISSNAGRDFALILSGFQRIGARDIAWRTFDAQYFGVPQRRRRIFLVADFRGERAGQVLFESEGSEGDFKPRGKARKGIARNAQTSTGINSFRWNYNGHDTDITPALLTDEKGSGSRVYGHTPAMAVATLGHTKSNGLGIYEQDIANTLEAMPSANQAVIFNKQRTDEYKPASVEPTLAARDYKDAGDLVVSPLLATDYKGVSNNQFDINKLVVDTTGHQGDRVVMPDGTWPTLSAESCNNGGGANASAFAPLAFQWTTAAKSMGINVDLSPTLTAQNKMPHAGQHEAFGVRRLTPIECEKLQGFPRNWTAVNNQSDAARYKQLGNAVCVNVSAWIGRRIMQAAFDSLWKEDAS